MDARRSKNVQPSIAGYTGLCALLLRSVKSTESQERLTFLKEIGQ